MSQQKILVAQGGGPTAVINQSLVGVALEARNSPTSTSTARLHGVRGIVDDDFIDLRKDRPQSGAVANTPSSALGSTRDKPDRKYCLEMFRVIRARRRRLPLYRRQ